MMNGKCRVWREGDKLCAEMELPTPTGPITWSGDVDAEPGDPTAEQRIESKVHSVAGFFPTEQMVGADVLGAAEDLYHQFVNPNTRMEADARIDLMNEKAAQGNEKALDLRYAAKRIAKSRAEKLAGFSFKKFGRFVKKNAKYALPVVGLPLAAIDLARRVRGGSRPAAAKVEALRVMANADPVTLPVKDEQGNPAPLPAVQAMQAQAAQAVQNVQAAAAREDAPEDYGPEEYGPEEYGPEAGEGEDESEAQVSGLEEDEIGQDHGEEIGGNAWQRGASALQVAGDVEEEEMAGLFDFVKKIAPAFDPTRKGAAFGGILKSIPGIGPAISSASDLIAAAKSGAPGAVDKVKTIKELSDAGVPKAQEAMQNLKTAQNLQNQMSKGAADFLKPGGWWLTRTYRFGAASAY